MKRLTCKITGKQFFVLLIVLALLPFSSVLASLSVSLSVTVVSPENRVFDGIGYLNIDDQRDFGDAVLTVPQSQTGSVRLEIVDGSQVSTVWNWEIEEYAHSERIFRKYVYVREEFQCFDVYGRLLNIVIHKYVRNDTETILVIAYGTGAFFTG